MLVVCKNKQALPQIETCEFNQGGIYRHMAITEDGEIQHMVYGVIFNEETFNKCFIDPCRKSFVIL